MRRFFNSLLEQFYSMQKLILKNSLSPGDIVMLTAAVRDLHLCYSGQFITDVRTPCPQLWEHNPYITPLDEHEADVRLIDCHYPLIQHSNQRPYHFIHAFINYLNEQLNLDIRPTAFKGDIHLSEKEISWYSQVQEIIGDDRPFWLIASGGKTDFTNKWWDPKRHQDVVDHFQGKICFVQVGRIEDHHPALGGVIDLRGKTSLRQLVRLVYHSAGIVCPVTALMHLAAAVPTKHGRPSTRPCVVIAGGREPSQWEAYPHHQFIHTIGALTCCEAGGCWKSRAVPLGDGDEKDRPENLCVNVVESLPKCMDMITAAEVSRRIELYFTGGCTQYLEESLDIGAGIPSTINWEELSKDRRLTFENAAEVADDVISKIPPYPETFRGRGIVICAGGVRYFTSAWVCISMLRHLGCRLPIQLWYNGPHELDNTMRTLVRKFDVQCVDVYDYLRSCPCNGLTGWALKPYAVINSPFREVLLLDADNVPIANPEALFEEVHYAKTGSVFWPDYGRFAPSRPVWEVFGVPFRNEPEFESGQILVNKEKCWKALLLTMWYNSNGAFFYGYVHGDKDTFHMAYRKLNQAYSMIPHRIISLAGTMCQHDFSKNRIFQHRNQAKWTYHGDNRRIAGFLKEEECLGFIEALRHEWSGTIAHQRNIDPCDRLSSILVDNKYTVAITGKQSFEILLCSDGTINGSSVEGLRRWDLRRQVDGTARLQLFCETGLTGELELSSDGSWASSWMRFGLPALSLYISCNPEFREGTTDKEVWKAVYDENLYGLPNRLDEDDVIIDVGAHIGAFGCACIARGARYLYAYEPDEDNYQLAVNNTKRWFHAHNPHQLHSPGCLDCLAVLPKSDMERVSLSPYPRMEASNRELLDTGGRSTMLAATTKADCRSFDLNLLLCELSHVTLLKLHCEGAEWPILFDCTSFENVERIVVCLHSLENLKLIQPFLDSFSVKSEYFNWTRLVDHLAAAGFDLVKRAVSSNRARHSGLADEGVAYFRKRRPVAGVWLW